MALDRAGNLYLTELGRPLVRKVSPSGIITTVAGNGISDSSGDGGPATSAQLSAPQGLAVDGFGNLYIADAGGQRVRKVSRDGIITTVAGTGQTGYSGDGAAAVTAQLNYPYGIALDGMGNLFIADTFNNRVRRVSTDGIITTVAGGGTSNAFNDPLPAISAQLYDPFGVVADSAGNLYVSNSEVNFILKVSPDGILTRIAGVGPPGYAGDGSPATKALFSYPWGLALDGAGNLYVADHQNDVVRVLQPLSSTPPVNIVTPPPLPPGTLGVSYAQSLVATGGAPPYSWSLAAGTPPAGLALSSTGAITGTPSASGSSIFSVQATDTGSGVAFQTFSLTIGPLHVTTPSTLPSGFVGGAYSETLTATGGAAPFTWALAPGSGVLPPGLALSSTGSITGTPSDRGNFYFHG